MNFELGQLVATRQVSTKMDNNKVFRTEVFQALDKYMKCDWGSVPEGDAAINDKAVRENNERILAAYNTCAGEIWIITEWDRSYTTIIFPSDY